MSTINVISWRVFLRTTNCIKYDVWEDKQIFLNLRLIIILDHFPCILQRYLLSTRHHENWKRLLPSSQTAYVFFYFYMQRRLTLVILQISYCLIFLWFIIFSSLCGLKKLIKLTYVTLYKYVIGETIFILYNLMGFSHFHAQ